MTKIITITASLEESEDGEAELNFQIDASDTGIINNLDILAMVKAMSRIITVAANRESGEEE